MIRECEFDGIVLRFGGDMGDLFGSGGAVLAGLKVRAGEVSFDFKICRKTFFGREGGERLG